jgi:hypothetical protein
MMSVFYVVPVLPSVRRTESSLKDPTTDFSILYVAPFSSCKLTESSGSSCMPLIMTSFSVNCLNLPMPDFFESQDIVLEIILSSEMAPRGSYFYCYFYKRPISCDHILR